MSGYRLLPEGNGSTGRGGDWKQRECTTAAAVCPLLIGICGSAQPTQMPCPLPLQMDQAYLTYVQQQYAASVAGQVDQQPPLQVRGLPEACVHVRIDSGT